MKLISVLIHSHISHIDLIKQNFMLINCPDDLFMVVRIVHYTCSLRFSKIADSQKRPRAWPLHFHCATEPLMQINRFERGIFYRFQFNAYAKIGTDF